MHPESLYGQRLFYRKLQKTVKRKLVALLVISTLLFFVGQYAILWYDNTANAHAQLETLAQSVFHFDSTARQGLDNDAVLQDVTSILTNTANPDTVESFETDMWQLENRLGIDTEVLLTAPNGDVAYSSLPASALTAGFLSYNRAICYNAQKSTHIYRAMYAPGDGYADTLYVKPVMEHGELLGFFSLYLSGSDWNFYLSESNYDGVVTDLNNNALYTSKPSLLTKHHQFYDPGTYSWTTGDSRYWVASAVVEGLDIQVYALVHYPPNQGLLFGALILAVMAMVWYSMAKWMNLSMAQHNAASIERLVGEIRQVAKGDLTHKIQMDTGDEFQEVAHQISVMLENILELNAKNTELIQMNYRIEMAQLTAQMNPHFLYNTLEMIRNLVIFDAQRAEDVLLALTKILRYSVNTSHQDVRFGDDLVYIHHYLDIQSCRFGDRFLRDMDIDQRCQQCQIPKLLLQPLIENSMKYGFAKKMDIHVSIKAWIDNDQLWINVSDDGLGMEEAEAQALQASLAAKEQTSASIGLRNLARRLWLRYGEAGDLRIENRPGEGFTVLVRLPKEGETPHV